MDGSRQRIRKALGAARRFIGPGGRTFRNEADDLVVQSRDEMREIRFDFKETFPHEYPHMHATEYEQVKNNKRRLEERRVWPRDVPST